MTGSETVGAGRATAARVCAIGAAAGAVLAVVGLVGAGAAVRVSDYLSELGVLDAPTAALYRGSVWVASAAIALLAVSLAMSVPSLPGDDAADGGEPELSPGELAARFSALALGNAAALLAGAAPFFVASGAIRCSPGCPLPPHDAATTTTDILHAGVSALGFACAVAAMYVLARGHAAKGVRVVSGAAAVVAGGAVALTGIAMLIQSHGVLNGIAERTATVAALVWLAAVGFQLGLRKRRRQANAPPPVGSADGAGRAQGLARVPAPEQRTVHE